MRINSLEPSLVAVPLFPRSYLNESDYTIIPATPVSPATPTTFDLSLCIEK